MDGNFVYTVTDMAFATDSPFLPGELIPSVCLFSSLDAAERYVRQVISKYCFILNLTADDAKEMYEKFKAGVSIPNCPIYMGRYSLDTTMNIFEPSYLGTIQGYDTSSIRV